MMSSVDSNPYASRFHCSSQGEDLCYRELKERSDHCTLIYADDQQRREALLFVLLSSSFASSLSRAAAKVLALQEEYRPLAGHLFRRRPPCLLQNLI